MILMTANISTQCFTYYFSSMAQRPHARGYGCVVQPRFAV